MTDVNSESLGLNEDNIFFYQKLHPDAQEPQLANEDDAGYDLVATNDGEITFAKPKEDPILKGTPGRILYVQYRTGIAIEPPKGYHTELFPRSSVSKYDIILCNGIGLVDNAYRGEIVFRYKLINPDPLFTYDTNEFMTMETLSNIYGLYKKGDKIGQIVIRKTIHKKWIQKDSLSSTVRGTGGFGSTGS